MMSGTHADTVGNQDLAHIVWMHIINGKCKNSGVFFCQIRTQYMYMWKFF